MLMLGSLEWINSTVWEGTLKREGQKSIWPRIVRVDGLRILCSFGYGLAGITASAELKN